MNPRLNIGRRFGLRNLFVVAQVAASLMLLLVTGYMVTGYRNTTRLDPGFNTANLELFSIDPVRDGYSVQASETLFASLPEELSRVSGVRAVALAGGVPFANLSADRPNAHVSTSSDAAGGREVRSDVFRERIGANYFATLGVPLVSGHEFDSRDLQNDIASGTATPAVINQSAARALFGAQNPIGRHIHEEGAVYTVVGMTRDARSGYLPPTPVATVFLPLTASWFVRSQAPRATVLVRGAGAATLVVGIGCAAAIARSAASVTAQLASIFQTRTNDPRLVVGAPLLLAGLALVACYVPARRATRIDPVAALREE